jgi:hypothetical protein
MLDAASLRFGFGNWFARKWTSLVFVQTKRKPSANQLQTNPEVFAAQALRSFGDWSDRWRGTQTKVPAGPAAGSAA